MKKIMLLLVVLALLSCSREQRAKSLIKDYAQEHYPGCHIIEYGEIDTSWKNVETLPEMAGWHMYMFYYCTPGQRRLTRFFFDKDINRIVDVSEM